MEAKQGPAQWRCCYASKYQSGGHTASGDGYEGDGGDGGEGDGVGVVVGMRRRNAVYLTSHLIIR